MSIQDFAKLLRHRWVTVVLTVIGATLSALILSLMTTPLYQASTRLFVSTTAGASATELYQGNRLSQDRVLSYTELIEGATVAQRTIDKLGLGMSPQTLAARVKATAKRDTVLIDVKVLDESAVRARDIANALSDEFVQLIRELETPRPGAMPDARVVVEQRASISNKAVVPNTSRNVAAGMALGLLAGIGLAVMRDYFDNTVKDSKTLEEITGAAVIGNVPLDKGRRDEPAISFESDNSGIAESFRKLRTNLHFLSVDNPPRLIVVTSSVPSEGKTTTAINIALALAEAEHNVLLVDGDMRRPSLDKYLELVGSVGFSTVLSGSASLSDVLQTTKFSRLTALTAGTIPPNPSELLGSLAAKKFLAELRDRFDYVIIDSAPLLAVTDAAILAANADGALVMARYGKTKRDQIAQTVETLETVGASTLGAVMTMTPTRGSQGYNYYYYYGADSKSGAAGSTREL